MSHHAIRSPRLNRLDGNAKSMTRRTSLFMAISLCCFANAQTAMAQQATETPAVNSSETPPPSDAKTKNQLDTITITGVRGSWGRTINAKRSETAVVDAISAEDVGKFPDTNLAESLQHITGVEITL